MKKTKIIVPALGMLLISTAASVTGTVAWFTANRQVNIQSANFSVTSLDGSLTAMQTPIVGVKAYDKMPAYSDAGVINNGAIEQTSTYTYGNAIDAKAFQIGDASFQDESRILWTDKANDAVDSSGNVLQPVAFTSLGGIPTTFGTAGNTWQVVNKSDAQFYAVAWKITFKYDFAGSVEDVNIFFNHKKSDANATYGKTAEGKAASEATLHTSLGFRVYMGTETDGNSRVWLPFRTTGGDKHVSAVDAAAGTYTNPVYGDKDNAAAYIEKEDLATVTANDADYVGKIAYDSTNIDATTGHPFGTLDMTCVAWFEGCDENVVNQATLDTISANMVFYCRKAGTINPAA